MTPEEQQKLHYHIEEISKILYQNAPSEQLQNLEGIEQVVRSQMQQYVMPEVGIFLSKPRVEQLRDTHDS
jgi:hypothetical protein